MPIDERRRDDMTAAVAAYDEANPLTPLPRNATRLLTVMFPGDDVCQRSLDDLARAGFDRRAVSRLLRSLIEAGFLSKERPAARAANIYHLHLPPRAQP
jgi:hypothetical protein